MIYQYYIETLGCSKNQVDSEQMIGLLNQATHHLVDSPEQAQIIIVNTCGFIEDAKQESIDTLLQLAQYKKSGICQYLIAAGCLSQRYADDLTAEIPEIDAFIGTTSFDEVVKIVQLLDDRTKVLNRIDPIDKITDDNAPRYLAPGTITAYLKIAEGCDNRCTYCIIPKLRGPYRSRKMSTIVNEAQSLASRGVKELIVIAQDTSRYGIDVYGDYKLLDLLQRLNQIDGLKWIRLQYMYPDILDEQMIKGIGALDKVVNYFDIPIQYADDYILKRMARHTTAKQIAGLVHAIRKHCSDATIRTTVIVGFPGETDTHFRRLINFIKRHQFDRLGAFSYSLEENTPAYMLDGQVSSQQMNARLSELMRVQQDISEALLSKKVGQIVSVLIEEEIEPGALYVGRSAYDAPEIDGECFVHSQGQALKLGSFVDVKISDTLEHDMIGIIQ